MMNLHFIHVIINSILKKRQENIYIITENSVELFGTLLVVMYV